MSGRFRRLRAVATVDLHLQSDGPLLVKGPEAADPARPDMSFVRYPTPWGDAPFLPGSSLKGVLRSGTEALLRELGCEVCTPFDLGAGRPACRVRCRACLLYGSVLGAGNLLVEDLMPWPPGADDRGARLRLVEQRRSIRNGVAIDRQTGAALGGRLFDYEVLVDVAFWGRLTVRNPEPWHLAVVAAGLALLDAGVLRIGSATTRGLGRMGVRGADLELAALDPAELKALRAGDLFGPPRQAGLWWRAEPATSGLGAIEQLAAMLPGLVRADGASGA